MKIVAISDVTGGYYTPATGIITIQQQNGNVNISGIVDAVIIAGTGASSTIRKNNNNSASGQYSTVIGGYNNVATQYGATVGGGVSNLANSVTDTVAGGYFNSATGAYSFIEPLE